MKHKTLRKLSILKLWKLTPFKTLSWKQILKAYEKEWKGNYKDFRSMKMALIQTLRIMIKARLIIKPERAYYQLTGKGIQYYKEKVKKIIELTKGDLKNLIYVL